MLAAVLLSASLLGEGDVLVAEGNPHESATLGRIVLRGSLLVNFQIRTNTANLRSTSTWYDK